MTHLDPESSIEAFKSAIEQSDAPAVRKLLEKHKALAHRVDERCFDLGAPAIVVAANAGNRALVETLLDFGADLNARSTYWGRTTGVLDESPPQIRPFLIERGAVAEITPFVEAVSGGNVGETRRLLSSQPRLAELIDGPFFPFGTPALVVARRDRELAELLLENGANIDARSFHGFGVLDDTDPEHAAFFLERGATVTIHAAAELNLLDRAKAILDDDPEAVNSRGGDGKTPLHVAKTPELVDLLLDRGADLEARCEDHRSTPLQYSINEVEVRNRLVERGAHVDLFAAAAIGDVALIHAELKRCPESIHARNHQEGYAPVLPGSIYNWKLGFKLSPHQVAVKYGNREAFDALMEASPLEEKLLNACLCDRESSARSIAQTHPDLVSGLSERDQTRFADAVWCGNLSAARLMLDLGFHPDTPYDEGPALMGACLFGNLAMIELLLERGAATDWVNDYGANPLGVAVWASKNFKNDEGDYPGCVARFLAAGLEVEPWMLGGGSEEVGALLRLTPRD